MTITFDCPLHLGEGIQSVYVYIIHLRSARALHLCSCPFAPQCEATSTVLLPTRVPRNQENRVNEATQILRYLLSVPTLVSCSGAKPPTGGVSAVVSNNLPPVRPMLSFIFNLFLVMVLVPA